MQNISVYLNQRASHTSFDYWKNNIDRSLFRSDITYRTPKDLNELQENLLTDIRDNKHAIVSVGGDGTVNTLIQSLAGQDIGLLVMPGGTANDLATELGNKESVKKVTHFIRNNEFKYIDLIKVNGNFMATNGGLGLGAQVAGRINQTRKTFPKFKKLMNLTGKSVYSFFILSELRRLSFPKYKIRVKSKQFSGEIETPLLLINNQPHLASTFNVAPETRNDDGKFNVTIFKHKSNRQFINCCYKMATGEYPYGDPNLISFETDSIQLENLDLDNRLDFFGDGEIFCSDADSKQVWNIESCPKSLKVYSKDDEKSLLNLKNEVCLS
ncbi:diacylglycerol kinase family protein [Halobacteriovorax sp. HLS]|uniref:diacylglycerol/lipid kinase family protein n=1 Tax=Halobacteriovorax sp. HLS TaxID=2234000 RepID=UPI000FDBE510|nr:diacylglycerol kinase family protein [Halobacteriovorax sp. HLS]